MSNKLLRQRKKLGLFTAKKKSTKIITTLNNSKKNHKHNSKNISSVQSKLEKKEENLVNQKDIETQLTEALEKHVLKKKRTNEEEGDWRNSCPVDLVPQSLSNALKKSLINDNRFSVQNKDAFEKALTKRKSQTKKDKKIKQLQRLGMMSEQLLSQKKGTKEEKRELGSWAKEKIKSFRNQRIRDLENQIGLNRGENSFEEKSRLWETDAFQNLKTDKSENKAKERELNFTKAKKSISYLNTKKLIPQKSNQYSRKPNTKLYYKSSKTVSQLPKPKSKKWSYKNKARESQKEPLNLSKNISHVKREKEFWNRLGSGKINSRMTRSFFLSKHGKSAIPSKPKYKKTKSKKTFMTKSKSALKRDLFKKGSSSFGNLFSEFRANYKQYKKKPEKPHFTMMSPNISSKMIVKGRSNLFDSKQRSRVRNKRKKPEKTKKENKKSKKLPAISFRTMQEGRFYSKYPLGRENQLEDALSAKMMKILSKMENLKETVKAEKQKLIYSGQKAKLGLSNGEFNKKKPKNSDKKEPVNYSKKSKSKRSTLLFQESNDFMPTNLTFSGPQKLKHLGQMSNKKAGFENLKELEEEKRELKLIPMKDIGKSETPEFGMLQTFKNPGKVGALYKNKRSGKSPMSKFSGKKAPVNFGGSDIKKNVKKKKGKNVKALSRNSSKVRSMKKKSAKASKSFSNLNSRNLIPRVGNAYNKDKQKKMKNYLYDNDKSYGSKIRNSNSIYNNRKGKKCYSLIGDSVRRLKYERGNESSQKIVGNKRRLRNMVRDKSLKLMQDYSNKNLGKRKRTSNIPGKTVQVKRNKKEEFNQIIEEKLRLLKTKLVHKSYEESKKSGIPIQNVVSKIEDNLENEIKEEFESDIPKAPFNSITMREVTPRFQENSTEKSNILKNSSILKKRNGNVFETDYFNSSNKKDKNEQSFNIGDFIRKHDPDNVFNNDDEVLSEGCLQNFKVQKMLINKNKKIEDIVNNLTLRVKVLDHLRNTYTQIMNN